MCQDGLYKIVYPSDTQLLREFDEALAVVRNGSVLCSDRNGGVYHGAGVLDADQRCFQVDMTIDVPAGRELVTGFAGGGRGAQAAVVAHLDPRLRNQRSVIHINGAPVEIEISYLGPLPN